MVQILGRHVDLITGFVVFMLTILFGVIYIKTHRPAKEPEVEVIPPRVGRGHRIPPTDRVLRSDTRGRARAATPPDQATPPIALDTTPDMTATSDPATLGYVTWDPATVSKITLWTQNSRQLR